MSLGSILTVVTPAASQALTTLANVKAELRIKPGDDGNDAMLNRAILMASSAALQYTRRTFLVERVNEQFRGQGFISPFFFGHSMAAFVSDHPAQHHMILRRRPIVDIVSITEDGNLLDPSSDFEVDDEMGFVTRLVDDLPWPWYFLKLEVEYDAGYTQATPGQAVSLATPIPALPYQLAGPVPAGSAFAEDLGVVNAAGDVPMTNVPELPAAGEYAVDDNGLYTFSAADRGSGISVKIASSYTTPGTMPAEIEQAVITLVRYLWYSGKRDPLLRSDGDPQLGQRQYWVRTPGTAGLTLPQEVRDLLDPHCEQQAW